MAPPRSTRVKAGKPKQRLERDSLSREVILDAARSIAEREGLDGLTFQAIGRELGAHPTSVYRHFRDKDELLLDLIDALRARSYAGQLTPSADWREDFRLLGRVIYDHYQRYPTFALQMAARTTRRPTEFTNVEFGTAALLRAGLSPESAARCLRTIGNYIRSTAAIQAALNGLDAATRHADDLAWELEYRQLDPEQYPSIHALDGHLRNLGDPDAYWNGLELILDGIERLAEREQAERAAPAERRQTSR